MVYNHACPGVAIAGANGSFNLFAAMHDICGLIRIVRLAFGAWFRRAWCMVYNHACPGVGSRVVISVFFAGATDAFNLLAAMLEHVHKRGGVWLAHAAWFRHGSWSTRCWHACRSCPTIPPLVHHDTGFTTVRAFQICTR